MIYAVYRETDDNRLEIFKCVETDETSLITTRGHIGINTTIKDFIIDSKLTNRIYLDSVENALDLSHYTLESRSLDEIKELAKQAFIKTSLQPIVDESFILMSVLFQSLSNYFMSKGYFITDENREDMYLQILNTGDQELINNLEMYLNVYDIVKEKMVQAQRYVTFLSDLDIAGSVDDIIKAYNPENLSDVDLKRDVAFLVDV